MQAVPGVGTHSAEYFRDQTSEQDGARLWVTNTTWQGGYYGGSGVSIGPFGVFMQGNNALSERHSDAFICMLELAKDGFLSGR